MEVPNGVCLEETPFTPFEARRARQKAFGFGRRAVALFIGSWHPPNLDAVERIVAFAPDHPDVAFLVVGSVGQPFEGRDLPPNVRLLGAVSAAMRNVLLGSADVALNPMSYGSGSNLKMLDYFAAGVPVLSTPFGARGLAVTDRAHAFIAPIEGFGGALQDLIALPERDKAAMIDAARAHVAEGFAWDVIARRFSARLRDLGLI